MELLINKIISHIPVLQVIIPMLAIFLMAAIRKPNTSYYLSLISSIINFALSIILALNLGDISYFSYALGNWQAPIGIEFRIDYLNLPIIILVNLVFFLFFLLGRKLLDSQIFSTTSPNKIWIIYSLLLLSQLGLLGMSSTGDLFNLYVFIEISSLAAYALLSLGKDKRAVIGAFHYLVLGTIGATFILIGIGLILAVTGSLNIIDVKQLNANLYSNKAFLIGICFYLTGSLLKIALIPLHSWMVQAYEYASSAIITAISGTSNFVGFYIIIRFIYSVLDYKVLYSQLNIGFVFEILGIISIITGSSLALLQTSFKKIVIFSSLTHIGYITLSLSFAESAMFQVTIIYLITDIILKTTLFAAISILENLKGSSELDNIRGIIKIYPRFTWLLLINILNNAALPPTMHFFNKLNLIQAFVNKNHIFTFIAIIIASLLGLLYNYKIINAIFFDDGKKFVNPVKAKPIDKTSKFLFYLLSTISIIQIFFYKILNEYTEQIIKAIF
ncbi:MAG: nuoN2 [Rickettsiaceae bacterium]|jgi:multicomponent Na+:H+ antiporter subunit D|nr:nuoN2 [Rickettsiaceae bacterium]